MSSEFQIACLKNPAVVVGVVNLALLLLILVLIIGRPTGQTTTASELQDAYDEHFLFHTRADAEEVIAALGSAPGAAMLADALTEIDTWHATDEELPALQTYKLDQLARLRELIAQELSQLYRKILEAPNGDQATTLYAEAGRLLARYPMDTSELVLLQAEQLSARHVEVGSRIEVIRRQRYNAWALSEIEQAISAIHKNASFFRTSDNPLTIETTLKHLGPIDPAMLEPVVSQLYDHALEQAKSKVNSAEALELAKRLVDPANPRKGIGDF